MTKSELKKIANNKKIRFCYIRKGPYYRPNACGYTDFITKAGVYTKEEAIKRAESCKELTIIPVNIDEHNKFIVDEVKDLLSRHIL